jgi:hypothetical protein
LSSFSNPLTEYSPQMEFASGPASEFEDESERCLFDESQELEWASRLLEASNEQQLDRSLHDMIREAGTVAGATLQPADQKAIAGVLKQAVREVLPTNMHHGSPMQSSAGAQLGSGLSSMAGQVLGLELEGLSSEDREFEAVKQFVRFTGQTVKNALEAAPGADPHRTAHSAATDAAQIYAPGLFAEGPHVPGDRGRWVACHDRIVLFGL